MSKNIVVNAVKVEDSKSFGFRVGNIAKGLVNRTKKVVVATKDGTVKFSGDLKKGWQS